MGVAPYHDLVALTLGVHRLRVGVRLLGGGHQGVDGGTVAEGCGLQELEPSLDAGIGADRVHALVGEDAGDDVPREAADGDARQ